jgi:hypothetical protein
METESHQFRTLHALSSNAVSASALSPNPPTLCTSETAIERTALLLGCYRKGDAEDPEIYSAAVAAVLSTYPDAIALKVTDPRSGIASRSQWLPTVAEIRGACEKEMAPILAEEARRARRAEAERYLAGPEAGRVSEARWKDLIAEIGPPPGKPSIGPKSEEWLRAFGSAPITISPELRAQLAHEPQLTEAE